MDIVNPSTNPFLPLLWAIKFKTNVNSSSPKWTSSNTVKSENWGNNDINSYFVNMSQAAKSSPTSTNDTSQSELYQFCLFVCFILMTKHLLYLKHLQVC